MPSKVGINLKSWNIRQLLHRITSKRSSLIYNSINKVTWTSSQCRSCIGDWMRSIRWSAVSPLRQSQVCQLLSISSIFYKQLLRSYSFGKKLQSQNVSREKLLKALSYKKLRIKCWWNRHLLLLSRQLLIRRQVWRKSFPLRRWPRLRRRRWWGRSVARAEAGARPVRRSPVCSRWRGLACRTPGTCR